jgi:hypothetical protein
MIKIRKSAIRTVAKGRWPGYVADIYACARHQDAQFVWISEEDYARLKRRGPGTELKALLKTIGIVASPTCSCNKRAQIMDEKGCDWCEEHIEEIDGWLAEEAKKRKLPYLSLAGRALIRLAIRRARKRDNS